MARRRKSSKQIYQLAQKHFGYDELRPGQEAAIQSVISGHDTLAVMPTGSGKSAIYQIAAIDLPGSTVVISPLIALQKDQVETIADQEIGGAAVVNSAVKPDDRAAAFEQLKSGELEFIFLAPEQFNNPATLEHLQAAHISLLVLDEAHCISEWGHDFRPDFLRLGTVVEALGHPTILALTATASPPVRQEIVERLGMRDPQVIVQGFDRPNIFLAVERFEEEAEKREALLQRVLRAEKPGIIYAATRKRSEEIAAELRDRSVTALAYHAGLKPGERSRVQTAFMNDEMDVIVATTAFGMGIDKPNVRFVFHADISDSVDSYYQEIGRAGRDGEAAKAVLFYNPEDLNLRRFFAGGGQVDVDQVAQVAVTVHQAEAPLNLKQLQQGTALSQSKITKALSRLEEVGVVELLPTGEVVAAAEAEDFGAALEEAVQAQEQYKQMGRSRLEMIRGYAEVRDCRREFLLNYFGETIAQPCGACDNCKAGIKVEKQNGLQPYAIESRVTHKSWGEGTVMRYEADKVVVLFDKVGYKTLGVALSPAVSPLGTGEVKGLSQGKRKFRAGGGGGGMRKIGCDGSRSLKVSEPAPQSTSAPPIPEPAASQSGSLPPAGRGTRARR